MHLRIRYIRESDGQESPCGKPGNVLGSAEHSTRTRQTHGKEDLDDGAVEELLFGWLEGWAES